MMKRLLQQHMRFSSSAAIGRLKGKIALITGGSKGLGKATAQEFIQQGARVLIADIDAKRGQQVASELGPKAHFILCDVGVEAQVAEAVNTALASHGKLDIMYNNAGILGPNPSSVTQLDLDQFDQVMRINVRGMMAGVKHAARVMIPAGSGSILCTASICGMLGNLGPQPYSVTKFAVQGIVKSMASELCKHGVRINCISPTAIATPMSMDFVRQLYPNATLEQLRETIVRSGEFKGVECEEIDIAKAAVYLASDEAKYVSGHNLVVDGGFTSYKHINFSPPDEQSV